MSDDVRQSVDEVEVTARLGSSFGDDETFERQRAAVRRALTFDGRSAWHGWLTASVNQDLGRWRALVEAADAGAWVQIGSRRTREVPASGQSDAPARL